MIYRSRREGRRFRSLQDLYTFGSGRLGALSPGQFSAAAATLLCLILEAWWFCFHPTDELLDRGVLENSGDRGELLRQLARP